MFIRVNNTPNSPRKSIQIVESVRTGDKVKQKILRYVGVAMNDYEQERLVALANDIMVTIEKERSAPELFDDLPPKQLGRKKKKELKDILPIDKVSLADIREESRIIDGVDEIAGLAYDELGFNKLLVRGSNQLLKDLILTRLVHPESKHKLCQIMSKQYNKEHSLSKIYRLMDQVYPKIDDVKRLTIHKTQSLMPNADVVLFDVTTLHFESIDTDGLREFGYSKNFRFNTTQVVLALATNEHGLPLGYELFEGNMAEVKTLLKSLNKWKSMFNIGSVCFVADRAMFSKENLTLLDASGYQYVVAAKLRSLSDEMQEQILDEKNYNLEQIRDDVMWTGCFHHKSNLLERFEANRLTFSKEEKQQLRDIYKVMCYDNDKFAEDFKENILIKLRYKDLTLAEDFKETLLNNKIFISGASSNKLIVSYRSARAKNDQHKRELILKKLQTKTGNVEKVINSGAKRYLSVNAVNYHCVKSKDELTQVLERLEQNIDDAVIFVVHDSSSELKAYINKSTEIKHIVTLPDLLFNEIKAISPKLTLNMHDELTKKLDITSEAIRKSSTSQEVKKILRKCFIDYLPDASTFIDENKINSDAIWDGMHGIITNIKDKSTHELLNKYHNLWRIEEAFRINKHNLKMRPIYHWNIKRIHAHIAMCYMSFAVLKLIQYKVELTQPKYSVIDIIKTMLSVQSSIHVHKTTKDKYKLPSSMSYEASALYKAFGVHRDLDASIYLE